MKVTIKGCTLTLTSDVTIENEVMMDFLQTDCPCDLSVDSENHIELSKSLSGEDDVEEEIKRLKNIMKDLEGAMLNKEVEEEAKKVDVDVANMTALAQQMSKLVDDVMAGKYGAARIAMFADNPTTAAYRGNMPEAAGALFAFLVANILSCTRWLH